MTVYHVYSQTNRLMSTHTSPSEAIKQALIYQHEHKFSTYVISEVICS